MVEPFSLPPGYKIQKFSQTFLDSLLYATTRGMAEIYIAEYRGEEVGRIVFVNTGAKYLIYVLNVSPEHRRKGIGSCLVQTVVRLADKPIYLSTYSAKNFYTRLGFTVEHEQEIFGFVYGYVMVLRPPA
ncbi:hypothetical protein CAL7716_042050 [Calothrix sp. PCC 7716]|nr:hypothetical protein CAL7716_042050 [Calothrix sp. PCC 7716]